MKHGKIDRHCFDVQSTGTKVLVDEMLMIVPLVLLSAEIDALIVSNAALTSMDR